MPFNFIVFLFYPVFSIPLPPLLYCKNNNEIAFLYENLLCARACITHLINIIPSNHDCTLGLFFLFTKYSKHLEKLEVIRILSPPRSDNANLLQYLLQQK